MNESGKSYTLFNMACPDCGSQTLRILGRSGSAGKVVSNVLFGAAGAMVNSARQGESAELCELKFKCESCGKKFASYPAEASEGDLLDAPCRVSFTRVKSVVGCAVAQVLYVNGIRLGKVKNGETITFEVNTRRNVLFVTDQNDTAFPDVKAFDAVPGGSLSFNFKRKFI